MPRVFDPDAREPVATIAQTDRFRPQRLLIAAIALLLISFLVVARSSAVLGNGTGVVRSPQGCLVADGAAAADDCPPAAGVQGSP